MFDLIYQLEGARRRHLSVKKERFTIGSGRRNDLVIKSRRVARKHATISVEGGSLVIEDLGTAGGTFVNRKRVERHGPIRQDDEIIIGNVRLRIVPDEALSPPPAPEGETGSAPVPAAAPEGSTAESSATAGAPQASGPAPLQPATPAPRQVPEQLRQLRYWGKILHEHLIAEMDLRRKDVYDMSDEQLRQETEQLLDGVMARLGREIPGEIDRGLLRTNVLNEAVGLGPLEAFLADESITEIMVNNHAEIFVERNGRLELSESHFSSDFAVQAVIERIITPLGRRIDEASPMVDARLKDGSRVNAIIPPLAIRGPSLTIRKFPQKRLQFDDLIAYGSISPPMVDFMRICVEQRKNVIVSGGTGSGKTTLLNVLSNFIPNHERIITVEDAAELKLHQPNLVSLEARPPNLEGRGQISIRDLVKNTLRMRPDRIVVGECRGGEALDMLQAMNTGHDGSLTTAHANSPRDVLSRLEVMVLMAGMDLPVSAIREQVASAVDVIVQQTRFPCGSRKITRITEVVGMESGTIQLQDIFVFRRTGTDSRGRIQGYFDATGFVPTFYEELSASGVALDLEIFKPRQGEAA
ncbi:MAG TPA: FHA domain-containing protein [Gammaproteobacteria bacterium]|nr:FHA domain-containing protein [Gammaproteobacteria bacterium]